METLFIVKSKIRQDLLALFFTNTSKSYYLRELQRMLGYSAGNIRRELLRFQKDNLFTTQKVGNLLYYHLNTTHPLFKELKSIVFKTVGVRGSIRDVLEKVGNVKFSFIYGSYAKAKEMYLSDIDLIVIGNVDEDTLIKKLDTLEDKFQREINYKLYTFKEFKKVIEEKEPFILEIIRDKKIMLIGNENELRKVSKG
jgi:predicted nucleotidyltransferase